MSFSANVRAWAEKNGEDVQAANRTVLISLFNSIIDASPVGNPDNWKINEGKNGDDDGSNNIIAPEGYVGGRFRANWQLGSGTPPAGKLDEIDASGGKAKARVIAFVDGLTDSKDFKVFFVNNLPYAGRLEYDGHSEQAPKGMVRVNLERISNQFSA